MLQKGSSSRKALKNQREGKKDIRATTGKEDEKRVDLSTCQPEMGLRNDKEEKNPLGVNISGA